MIASPVRMTDWVPPRVARVVGCVGATLVALFLVLAPATPARADASIDACFNAVADAAKAGIEQAKLGPEFAASGCAVWLNPATAELFGAVVGTVTALEAAGAFKGGDCKDFIKTKISAAVVTALAASLGGNSPLSAIVNGLPDSAKAEIQQLANNISAAATEAAADAAANQAYDLLANIPVVGQAISMLPCACIVADAAIKTGNDLAKAASDTGDCAKFALACAGNPLQCAQSLFESGVDALEDLAQAAWGLVTDALDYAACLAQDLCHSIPIIGGIICDPCEHPSPPPPPTVVDCVGGATLSGDVRDVNGGKVSVSTNQVCSCPATMKWQNNAGTWSCVCPLAGQVQVAHGICQCPAGQGLLEGSCQSCPSPLEVKYGACACPIEGQQINNILGKLSCSCPNGQATAGNKCVAICTDVSKILLGDGTCCSPSQVSSCGVCCPSGQKPDPKSGSCIGAFTPKPGLKPFTPLQSR